jgi:hypothetical protein
MQQGKSSYEIRSDLLRLSFDILTNQFDSKKLEQKPGEEPTPPTTEDVIAEAAKLNKFVSKDR